MAKRFNIKKLIFPLLIVVAIALLAINKLSGSKKAEGPPQGGAAAAIPVKGFIIKTQKLENHIMATGTLLAMDEIELKAEISGRITGIFFQEGGRVSKGQLLVKLFDADLQAEKRRIELAKELAGITEGRLKELLKVSGVSQQEYDAALNQLNSLDADLALVNAKIQKTEIKAPFSGKIGLQKISNGAIVVPSDVIATLQETEQLKLDFSIPEKYLVQLRSNPKVDFKIEGTEQVFTADVYAIEPKIDLVTRTVQIRARLKNKSGELFPGAYASVLMPLEIIENGILIPTEAIVPELRGQKVFVSRGGVPEGSEVITGIRNDSMVQVIKGLAPGDTIITTGMLRIGKGTTVRFSSVR